MSVEIAHVVNDICRMELLLLLAMKRFALPGSIRIPRGLLKVLLPLKTVIGVRENEGLQNLTELLRESVNQSDPKQSG